MRVFVTGATGFVGTAVSAELKAAGHEVLGLARNDAAAEALARVGVEAHRGELADTDSLAAAARACDGVIHLGFIHDWSNYALSLQTDLAAVEAMVGAMEGTGKPLVNTGGTLMVAHVSPGTEVDSPMPGSPRSASEAAVLAAADRGVRGCLVRLSPTVHDAGDHGFVPRLIAFAREKGVSPYIGDGQNRWPAVHRRDAARLYRLAVEKAPAGARLHGAGEAGIAFRAIAEAIGEGVGVPARSLHKEEAFEHFNFLAGFVGMDNLVSNAVTRESLGWEPRELGLIEDMRASGYFD